MDPSTSSPESNAFGKTGVILIFLSLIVGLATTGYGLAQQEWPEVLRFWRTNTPGYLFFVAGSALLIALGAKFLRIGQGVIVLLLALAVALLAQGVGSLVVLLFYLGASLSVGHLIFKGAPLEASTWDHVYRILVGASLYASLVGIAVHFKVNYAWVYFVALALPMVLARDHLLQTAQVIVAKLIKRPESTELQWVGSILGAFLLLYFTMAFLPELSHDPLAMHLFVPAHVAAHQAWNFDPSLYIWTFMPMLADWSYTIAYVLAGESAARLVNFGFLLICTAIVREFVLLLGGDRRGANWAALLVLSTPVTLLVGCSLYVETYWSACLLAGALWIFKAVYEAEAHPSGMVRGGVVLGFAVAAKSVALPYLPWLALPVLHRAKLRRSKSFWISMLVGGGVFVVLGVWPYALAYLETGNPVFPFFNSVFESPLYPATDFTNSTFARGLSWDLPYALVFSARDFGATSLGGAGFQWLTLALPAFLTALLVRNRRGLMLCAIAALSLAAVFHFQSFVRYVVPVILLVCVLGGLTISLCARHRVLYGSALAAITVTLALNALFLGSTTTKYGDVPVLDLFRVGGQDRLIQNGAPMRKAVELVNVVNQERFPVAVLASPTAAGLDAQALFANWYNPAFLESIKGAQDRKALLEALQRYRARYLIYDSRGRASTWFSARFVEQVGDPLGEFGSVTVYRVRDDLFFDKELLREQNRFDQPAWRLSRNVEFLEGGTIVVTKKVAATQSVVVDEGDFYLNSIRARCLAPGRARVQANWHDESGALIETNIRVFNCDNRWTVAKQTVVAPHGATIARVYGAGHDWGRVEISGLSFRGIAVEKITRTSLSAP